MVNDKVNLIIYWVETKKFKSAMDISRIRLLTQGDIICYNNRAATSIYINFLAFYVLSNYIFIHPILYNIKIPYYQKW
jgi:hypothetical protein